MTAQIILTRPEIQACRFASVLTAELGPQAHITVSPLLEIKFLDFGPVSSAHDVIFTSENGVAGFANGADIGTRRAFCVGDRTAEAAREAGFDARSARGTSRDLIALIAEDGGGEMIYARGEHIARDLKADLAVIGIPVTEALVYAQSPVPLNAAASEVMQGVDPVIFPLFSARSMRLLMEQDIGRAKSSLVALCISEGVASAANDGAFDAVHVSDAPNSDAMIEKLRRLVA